MLKLDKWLRHNISFPQTLYYGDSKETIMTFRILDLFCGAGGFSYGLEQNNDFTTLVGVDFDKKVEKTFLENHKNAVFINGDLTNSKIKNEIISLSKSLQINMIIGGPPCQGFSLKGKQLGLKDPRNFLFLEFLDIVNSIKPEIVLIENVKTLISTESGFFIKEIRNKLKEIGYIINDGILNAKDFGVPQNRERAIVIGSLSKSVNLPKSNIKDFVNVYDAISDLSYLNSGEGENISIYITSPLSNYQKILRNADGKLYNHIATKHSKLAIEKLNLIPSEGDKSYLPEKYIGKQKFKTTWSRLRWNDISPTIDTRFDTPSNGRNSHPYLNRAITPREAARLQSFSDSFIFFGNKTSICKQIGNAVPPLLAKAIGNSIIETYNEKIIIDNNYKLIHSDSLFFVKQLIKDKVKVDHIITDPPYNISKKNNFSTMSNRKGVDFGEWDKDFDIVSWIDDYAKILKPGGTFIIFCSYLYLDKIIEQLDKNNVLFKDVLIWKKLNPMPRNTNRRYVLDKEFAIWAVKEGSKWVFNKPPTTPYIRAEFESGIVSGKERTSHPTQKSLKVLEKIIEIHSNPGDLIIDPFMGSGTTGVATIKLKRKFIGIENDYNYFSIACKRMKEGY